MTMVIDILQVAANPSQVLESLGMTVSDAGIQFLRMVAERGIQDDDMQAASAAFPLPFTWY
ncbi:hypothetical protein [Nitrospirillum iridis]|uniref:Antitoxin component of RelBE/YafQ-DinJ toxin-antitoxin module n=1 Tax=Nitrospirillum iridis TaxID=765888 RepID=A0A7X0EFU3_9PROT|nr:hypothetical protein [Nitrospirillum iridis]MBB6252854.1 antitoxin component of RelBE/YafQ-DinJ toxin-antitoxin module [Nitrospirillum iridis]